MYSKLKDRILWFDGDSTVEPDLLADIILKGMNLKKGLYVSDITDEIKLYNRISSSPLSVKDGVRKLSVDWNIPERYKKMNLKEHVFDLLDKELSKKENSFFSEDDISSRVKRVLDELKLFKEHSLFPLLKALCYIIDTFKEKNIVWGVGRGSSCSSYILYLIGVHDIDSVRYDLDIRDFIR